MGEDFVNRSAGTGPGEPAVFRAGAAGRQARAEVDLGPGISAVQTVADGETDLSFHSLPAMRYPGLYLWFVAVSSADIILTWLVLGMGGREVNPVAATVIGHWGLPGAIAFKFSLMLMVIVLCEVIGRKRDRTARRLAGWSVGVSALAPAYTVALVAAHVFGWI